MARTGFLRGGGLLVIGLFGVTLLLRSPITAVPPALATVRDDLGLSEFAAGATTSLPLICFGVFAFLAPFLIARWGLERAMPAVLIPLLAGIVLRSAGLTWTFFVGAVLVGSGIAVGNVLVPALIRARFAGRVALFMGLYTAVIQVSGAVGSALTAPLQTRAGWSWEFAVGIWALPAILTLAWWWPVLRHSPPRDTRAAPPTGMGTVVVRPMTWVITVFMGLQSLVYYSLLTWLPDQLTAAGHSEAGAGLLLGLFSLLGLPGAFLAPRFATGARAVPFLALVYGGQALGVTLLGFGTASAAVGVVLIGLAQGASFSIAMTFIADQPHAGDVPALAAFAQGAGYMLAATGPMALGAIFAAAGTWWAPNAVVLTAIGTVFILGCIAGTRLHAAHRAAGR